MNIKEIIDRRGITEILHFTKNLGLTGTLHSGHVKSRARLDLDKELQYIFEPNASFRKDREWLDYVNLSISEINSQFFGVSSCNWHAGRDLWWCILAFSPEIILHDNVVFATTNNIYTGVRRGLGAEGLDALFSPRIVRWSGNMVNRQGTCPQNLTTCEQAEVLYPQQVSTEFLQRIYVRTEEDADDVNGQLSIYGQRPDIVVHPEKFRGAAR